MDAPHVVPIVFSLIGILMLLIPGFFVRILIWVAKFNYEQNIDKYNQPKYSSIDYWNKTLGVNKENLSRPPSAVQKWLIRILGVLLIILWRL